MAGWSNIMRILKAAGALIGLTLPVSVYAEEDANIQQSINCTGNINIIYTILDASSLRGDKSRIPEKTLPHAFSVSLTRSGLRSVTAELNDLAGCLRYCNSSLYGYVIEDENVIVLSNHDISSKDLAIYRNGGSFAPSEPVFSIRIELSDMTAATHFLMSEAYIRRNLRGFRMTSANGAYRCG